jgi:hypothetical protein
MRATALVRTAACLVGVLLLTAACGTGPDEDVPPPLPGMTPVPVSAAVAADDDPVTDAPADGDPAAAAPADAVRPMRDVALSDAEIDAVLLGTADVPAGWDHDTSSEPTAEQGAFAPEGGSITPAECEALGAAAPPPTDMQASGGSQFYTEDLHYVAETVATWAGDPRVTVLDPLTAFVAACPTITVTESDGSTIVSTLAVATAPKVGDRAVAYVLDVSQTIGGTDVHFTTINYTVVVGHVVITLMAGGADGLDPAVVEQLVITATAKVEAAVA